jgi:hypothetical protein
MESCLQRICPSPRPRMTLLDMLLFDDD